MSSREFWSRYQPGFRFATAPIGTKEFFEEVTKQRYDLEPHIPEIVDFPRWTDCRVLEAGCGIGTDGAQFAAAGAQYTGLDFSMAAPALARRRFELDELRAAVVAGSVTDLPFPDNTFDLVFSHGVIHHIEATERAVTEFHRVLKPGGTVLVMVYHRRSLNYYVSIMLLRRFLVASLLIPGTIPLLTKLTGEPRPVLRGHRELLKKYGLSYVVDRRLFLSRNTDGPENPLAKVYSQAEARSLFSSRFCNVQTDVRYLNLRIYPGGLRLAKKRPARFFERRAGWHLYVTGRKPE